MICPNCKHADAWILWCEFCDKVMCEQCTKSSDFGHVCQDCLQKINDGRIDENGVEHGPRSQSQ